MEKRSGFYYENDELHCDGAPVEQIVDEFETPCYVYSSDLLKKRYRMIRDAFGRWDPLVCFSVKSLPNLAVLTLLHQEGSGFDVVSGGELFRVIQAGGDPGKVVYAGVGKTTAEIEFALESGVRMFNVESSAEMESIARVADEMGQTADIALRINPDVDAGTHQKTTTGKKENKFGISIRVATDLASRSLEMSGIRLRGLHVHLGSPIYKADPYVEALEKLSALREELSKLGCEIDTINLGGGYCISYTGEKVPGPEKYAAALQPFLENLDSQVIIEPGRFVSGPSGILLTRVIYRKVTGHGKRFLVCDAGMNDLLRPTLYGSFHRLWPARAQNGMPEIVKNDDKSYDALDTEIVDVVGPVCESGDFFAKNQPLPKVKEGAILAIFDTG
ncbi:MAG: diaminopimelate decarboxylase, partial [Planctomycetes bacterium]|nr:diaminopimelate decarboxylase [Planctomycetota bacterium]